MLLARWNTVDSAQKYTQSTHQITTTFPYPSKLSEQQLVSEIIGLNPALAIMTRKQKLGIREDDHKACYVPITVCGKVFFDCREKAGLEGFQMGGKHTRTTATRAGIEKVDETNLIMCGKMMMGRVAASPGHNIANRKLSLYCTEPCFWAMSRVVKDEAAGPAA